MNDAGRLEERCPLAVPCNVVAPAVLPPVLCEPVHIGKLERTGGKTAGATRLDVLALEDRLGFPARSKSFPATHSLSSCRMAVLSSQCTYRKTKLISTLAAVRNLERRDESRRGTHECVRHKLYWRFHDSSSLCALSHGLSAHRKRAYLHLQLALCAPPRRHHDPAHRRYRRRTQHRSLPRIPSSTASTGSISAGTNSTNSPIAWPSTARSPRPFSKRAWPIAISRPRIPANRINRRAAVPGSSNPGMRELSREESDRRAAAGEPFACASASRAMPRTQVTFKIGVYGEQSKSTADIEDFALLRSDGMPTYHLASCADDADLKHQPHRARPGSSGEYLQARSDLRGRRASTPPEFAHLPLLVAPDGAKLSKRKHGPVVSVTTYRDAGFLPAGVHQFSLPARLVAQERSRADDRARS